MLFKTKLYMNVKFFYPWDNTENKECAGYSLFEEIGELMWEDFTKKVDKILKRFNITGWDFENDSNDFIEVYFNPVIDSDTLHSEIDQINSQLGYLWDQMVKEAHENIQQYECEVCDDVDEDGNCRGRDANGRCRGGFDLPETPKPNKAPWEVGKGKDYWNTPPKPAEPNVWDTNTPKLPKEEGWNLWNK